MRFLYHQVVSCNGFVCTEVNICARVCINLITLLQAFLQLFPVHGLLNFIKFISNYNNIIDDALDRKNRFCEQDNWHL